MLFEQLHAICIWQGIEVTAQNNRFFRLEILGQKALDRGCLKIFELFLPWIPKQVSTRNDETLFLLFVLQPGDNRVLVFKVALVVENTLLLLIVVHQPCV